MVWNLMGQVAPILVAIIAIPILIHGLGTARFGVLALAWVVVGYASLFDFGLGRALTQLLSRQFGSTDSRDTASMTSTALALMFILGIAGTLITIWVSPFVVYRVLQIPNWLDAESLTAFYVLACSVPFVISAAGLRGILEAHQRFGMSNAVRIPLGIFTFLGPAAVLPFSRTLPAVVGALLVGRILAWLGYLVFSLRVMPGLRVLGFNRTVVWPLLRFGSWMTVSNVIGPVMVYLDRFLIGALISVSAVAYYAVPYETITKLVVVASALSGVLFPAFAYALSADPGRARRIFGTGVKVLLLFFFPLTLATVALAHNLLAIWLGPDFADHSAYVLRWLAIGVLANSLAQVPFAAIQAAGRPDLTAKLHAAELVLYVPVLLWLLKADGIDGAAFAWMLRTTVDMVVLFLLAQSILPVGRTELIRIAAFAAAAGSALGLTMLPGDLTAKVIEVVLLLAAFFVGTWIVILSPAERSLGRQPQELGGRLP
jgi:O-antigen/teichoic acid export membrane protein